MLLSAKHLLEQYHGYKVIAGYVSPSHDFYVGPKAKNRGGVFVNAEERVSMCQLAVKEEEEDWIEVGTWEARHVGRWPDYPEVMDNLMEHVSNLSNLQCNVTVFYVCGTDHARYCGEGFRHPNQGLVVVSRAGDPLHTTNTARLVFGSTSSSNANVEALSSSNVREACASGDVSQLRKSLHNGVATHVIRRGLYGYRRPIFLTASALARAWRAAESSEAAADLRLACDAGLFFFGSKRSWLFPATDAERTESRSEGRYEPPFFPKELADLILSKESRTTPVSEVYFLKPKDLLYGGFGTGCHPPDSLAPAFRGASEWLERHGYAPLQLEREWWLRRSGDEGGYSSCQSRTGVTGRAVVENYEIGEHDYDPCIELLHQSNPMQLDPVLNPIVKRVG